MQNKVFAISLKNASLDNCKLKNSNKRFLFFIFRTNSVASGHVSDGAGSASNEQWTCIMCTFLNPPNVTNCEMCNTPNIKSGE